MSTLCGCGEEVLAVVKGTPKVGEVTRDIVWLKGEGR